MFFKGPAPGFVVCVSGDPWASLRRSLVDGPLAGFVSLLGASTADAPYGFIAGLGIANIGNLPINEQTLISLPGGAVPVALGFKLCFTRPKPRATDVSPRSLMD